MIARSAFLAHMERTPLVLLAVIETIGARCGEAWRRQSEGSGVDTLGRVAGSLAEFADLYGQRSTGAAFRSRFL